MAQPGRGRLEAIHVHRGRSAPMVRVDEAELEAGFGIRGDDKAGLPIPGTNLTLIAAEGIEAAVAESGIQLTAIETRRNLLTRGVELDALVGRRFRVGAAVCLGVKTATPCNHLEELTRPGVRAAIGGRAGLRADILAGGVIRPGDVIEPLDDD
jgi:MOSC domain-containing protein YiiM